MKKYSKIMISIFIISFMFVYCTNSTEAKEKSTSDKIDINNVGLEKCYISHYYDSDKIDYYFLINTKGICTYEYYDKENPKNNKSYICELTNDEIAQIINKIANDLKYFDLKSDRDSSGTRVWPKVFSIQYGDKRSDLYAFTKDKKEYQPLFKYFDVLIKQMEKKANKPMDQNASENFTLEYIEHGSMFPRYIELKINPDGSCYYKSTSIGNGANDAKFDHLEYQLTDTEYKEIVDQIMNKFDFYNIPMVMEKRSEMMDGNTYQLTVKYKGKIHGIGGYESYDYPKFQPVFKYVEGIMKKIEKKGRKFK